MFYTGIQNSSFEILTNDLTIEGTLIADAAALQQSGMV